MATTRDFYKEFTAITRFEIVGKPKESDRQIRIIGRVRVRAVSRAWSVQFVDALVRASTDNPRWSVDISRYYFLQDHEVIWAWRIIIQAAGIPIEIVLDEILRALRLSSKPQASGPAVEVTEIPLVIPHTQPTTKNGRRSKGAWSVQEKP